MKCLTGFMRKECKRRRSSKIGVDDRVNDLDAMVWAVAPELFRGERCLGMWIRNNRPLYE